MIGTIRVYVKSDNIINHLNLSFSDPLLNNQQGIALNNKYIRKFNKRIRQKVNIGGIIFL